MKTKVLSIIGVLALLGFALSTHANIAFARSCSNANSECKAFCARNPGKKNCPSTCAKRFKSCLRNGTFRWTNSQNETNLKRQ